MYKNYPKFLPQILLFLFFLILGEGLRYLSEILPEKPFASQRIEKTVNSIRQKMSDQLDQIPIESYTTHEELWRGLDSLQKKDFDYLIFQGHELVAWNNHILPVEGINPQYFRNPLVRLDNGWYLTSYRQYGSILAVGFTLFKQEYPYENQFLRNGFSTKFDLAPTVLISREQSATQVGIHDTNGEFLFSLIPNGVEKDQSAIMQMSRISFLISILFLWLLVYRIQFRFSSTGATNRVFFLASGLFALVYYLIIWQKNTIIPDNSALFSPRYFAMSEFLPSLGHFLLYSILIFSVSFWFFKFFRLPDNIGYGKRRHLKTYVALGLFLAISALFIIYINQLFYLLAKHSAGSLIITKVIDFDLVAFTKMLIVALLLLSFLMVLERIVVIFLLYLTRWQIFTGFFITFFLLCLIFRGIGIGASDWAFLLFFACSSLLIFSKRRPHLTHSYSTFLWFAGLFAIYAGVVLMDLSIRKEESGRELLIENLAFQLMRDEDPVAEMYLSEIEKQISSDATLSRILDQPEPDPEAIRNHLVKFYFYGFWNRYDMQIIPCWPQGDLYIEETGEIYNCYQYFFHMLDQYAYTIPGSNHFHYLDNLNGRVSYFGVFRFFPNDPDREISLFIELHSKAYFEGLGYPELLISEREYGRLKLFRDYSYAKYLNGRLVRRSGDYLFKNELSWLPLTAGTKVFMKESDHSHLLYQHSGQMAVMLSRQDFSIWDVFMAFSIFFIFFFLTGALIILIMQWRYAGFSFRISIQKRIQVAFVMLLLLMLVIVAIGTVYYTVQQFERKHLELLESKIQSILMELEYKVGLEGPETTNPGEYLNYQLQMISNVFHADINLYGVDGKLTGTSRPELFHNGLAGRQMNPNAYFNLAYTDAVRYLAEERIGNLSYISFYVPVITADNRLAGFVNLPYFVGNNELRDEISSVIVTVINFYLVFSFLVVGFAVFLARQITRPLLLLQERISSLKLDHLNEKIDYKGEDEIGSLVKEYNRMVDELAISAEKLAKSERDLAWREMAKQIAHEIKNPLTPMKLSIQYLQRAWNDQVEDFDSYMKKVTQTLIEQINNLSSIASEFSKFAQMPSAKTEIVNLIEKIENSRTLFANSTKTPIEFINMAGDPVYVKADGEQLLGVFNNLIKNAIQSIPSVKTGKIEITVTNEGHGVRVAIKDNGKGIPEEITDKLFVPSFTTKTGGMGLGLAIARRIIENAGGHIWFETEINKGSIFYVQLPYKEESSLSGFSSEV
ncbi:sensor histidine kinase [Alkalitalea saponilacus]|uniref:histidine kinase n=1 Tax=Alkalitalea saponilacus TaxID=889453 RepID=A0A1T5HT45_9BACT|nr:HAMP domain-containing sensor histidine kinase [Alkalitalea saponilacus]SKC23868.1 HAMP domain-containing protein [Alkalitalea saponilacus]